MKKMNTKEGEVFKQQITRYFNADGQRVQAGTPGARKKVVETKQWYSRIQDPRTKKWSLVALSKDKQVSRKKLVELEQQMARGEAGLVDPYEQTKKAPIAEHIKAYMTDLKALGRTERYREQTQRDIEKVLKACDADRLADLTTDKLDNFLAGLTCSARTKNCYRQAVLGLCSYLVRKEKLPENPIRKATRSKGEVKRKRRALLHEDLQKLLDAAAERPLVEAMTIRRGSRKGQLGARVASQDRLRLEQVGRHRALLYLTAIHTGLRLNTLRQLRVSFLDLVPGRGTIEVPGNIMKSGRDFKVLLRDDLVAELQAWVAESGKNKEELLFDIPRYSQLSKLLRKDLRKAGIDYQDPQGRFFDFHSFRKCTGSFLRQGKVDPSVSMLYLDHSDIRMTMEVYNDGSCLDMRGALEAIPALTIQSRGS